MMKPLTVEQLKVLPIGDWVWVVDYENHRSKYRQLTFICEEGEYFGGTHFQFTSSRRQKGFSRHSCNYGKTWVAYKNKEQAMGISNYISECVALTCALRDKENLERTIEEINEVLEANGIKIDCNGNVSDDRVEQVKKQTAKEVLQEVWNTGGTILAIQQLAAKYGVEVEE